MSWRTSLARRSRSPRLLWRIAIGIVAAGAALSFLTPLLPESGDMDAHVRYSLEIAAQPDSAWRVLAETLADPEVDFYDALRVTATVGRLRDDDPPADLFGAAAVRARGKQPIEIAQALLRSVRAKSLDAELTSLAGADPVVPYANFALALYWRDRGDVSEALAALLREAKLPHAEDARQMVVDTLVQTENWAGLEKLASLPEYKPLVPYYVRAQVAAERGDWLTVLRVVPQSLWRRWEWGPGVLAIFTGACWLAFLLHAGRVGHRNGVRWPLCVAGLALGVLSIPVTHFFIYYQEVAWGLVEQPDIVGGIKYFVLGVGLREELSKLLLLAPLLPILARGRSELEALIVSACVGLGFAVVENIAYFAGSMGTSTIGRLTTANFLHMSLTGLVGLAACRGLWHPRTAGPEAFAVFGVAVLAHGLYDLLVAVPALATDYSFFGIIIYVLLAYQFFRELNAARPAGEDAISLTFTLVVGVALVTSATFVYVSSLVGQAAALKLVGTELIGSGVMIYLFLRESPDSLIDR